MLLRVTSNVQLTPLHHQHVYIQVLGKEVQMGVWYQKKIELHWLVMINRVGKNILNSH
jgi:hypothetical protein